jgi:hypothetical protein
MYFIKEKDGRTKKRTREFETFREAIKFVTIFNYEHSLNNAIEEIFYSNGKIAARWAFNYDKNAPLVKQWQIKPAAQQVLLHILTKNML